MAIVIPGWVNLIQIGRGTSSTVFSGSREGQKGVIYALKVFRSGIIYQQQAGREECALRKISVGPSSDDCCVTLDSVEEFDGHRVVIVLEKLTCTLDRAFSAAGDLLHGRSSFL